MERVFVEVKAEFLILAAGGFTEGKRTLNPLMPSLALERIRTENPPLTRGRSYMSFQMLGQFGSNNELNPFDKQMLSRKQLYGCQSVMCNTFPPSF